MSSSYARAITLKVSNTSEDKKINNNQHCSLSRLLSPRRRALCYIMLKKSAHENVHHPAPSSSSFLCSFQHTCRCERKRLKRATNPRNSARSGWNLNFFLRQLIREAISSFIEAVCRLRIKVSQDFFKIGLKVFATHLSTKWSTLQYQLEFSNVCNSVCHCFCMSHLSTRFSRVRNAACGRHYCFIVRGQLCFTEKFCRPVFLSDLCNQHFDYAL